MTPPQEGNERFAVVIPTHNYGRYLRTSLQSAAAQQPGRIIVVDDASDDNTASIVAGADGPIEYVRLDQQAGPGGAWAAGLRLVETEFAIPKLDADDWLLPGFLARAGEAFDGSPEIGLVVGGTRSFVESPPQLGTDRLASENVVLEPSELRSLLLGGFPFKMPAMAMRSALISGTDSPRDDLVLGHDWEYVLRATEGWGALLLAQPVAVIRLHTGSVTDRAMRTKRTRGDLDRFLGGILADGRLTASERTRFAAAVGRTYFGMVDRPPSLREVGRVFGEFGWSIGLVARHEPRSVPGTILGCATDVWRRARRSSGRAPALEEDVERLMPEQHP